MVVFRDNSILGVLIVVADQVFILDMGGGDVVTINVEDGGKFEAGFVDLEPLEAIEAIESLHSWLVHFKEQDVGGLHFVVVHMQAATFFAADGVGESLDKLSSHVMNSLLKGRGIPSIDFAHT